MQNILISKEMANGTVSEAPLIYKTINNTPPENIAEYYKYDEYIDDVRRGLSLNNDDSYAKLVFEYVLTSPSINIRDYNGGFPYSDGELEAILEYIYKGLWPNAVLPKIPPPIELIEMDQYEWREQRAKLNPHLHVEE